jgi:N-acetylglutamate synthase-like GNAT family acetyltransferase
MKFARKEDAARVAELFREINSKASKSDIEELIQKRKVVVFFKKKKIAGAFSFALFGAGFLSFLYIRKLAVDKKLRGKGLGSVVLQRIKKFSLRQKAGGFFLWSITQAVGFYRKNRLSNLGRIFWWWK